MRGLSTGDFRPALEQLLGEDACGLSASTISRLCKDWEVEHERFRTRSLRFQRYAYWFVDGVSRAEISLPEGKWKIIFEFASEEFGRPSDRHVLLAGADRLPGFHDLVEYVHPVGQFREGLDQRPAEQIPVAGQPETSLVGEIDDQVGPGQVRHSGGQARQQLPHEREPAWWGVPAWDRNRDLRYSPRH